MALNNELDQMDLNAIHRNSHPKEAKYTFFSNAHGTFSKTDHMVKHKTTLNIQENLNHIDHLLGSQWLETRNQPQGKNSKTFKHMETDYHVVK